MSINDDGIYKTTSVKPNDLINTRNRSEGDMTDIVNTNFLHDSRNGKYLDNSYGSCHNGRDFYLGNCVPAQNSLRGIRHAR